MSSNQNNEFDVLKVVELARHKKYEITSAGFAALDKIDKINSLPKKMRTRKPAVQALHAIAEGLVKYDYFTPEERRRLLQEAGMSDAPYRNSGVANAPVAEEDFEEEYIPEDEPKASSASDEEGEFDEMDDDSDYEDDDFEEENEESEEPDEEP